MRMFILILTGVLSFSSQIPAQQQDKTGCKDHPLFTRMPDSWIRNCTEQEFNTYAFRTAQGKTEQVEGRLWTLQYYPQANATSKPSEVQILRNFENAVKKLGGSVLFNQNNKETLRLTKDGKEVWVEVWAEFTGKYGLTIVERQEMAQDIIANADVFAGDIKATGHAAVYGIYFETGKSEIQPNSEQALGEIAKLLRVDTELAVYIVGHTDNVGSLDANMKLSQARADAVIKALVKGYGINAERMKSYGAGPYAPVASNDTEEGRAKNRRVELTKQ